GGGAGGGPRGAWRGRRDLPDICRGGPGALDAGLVSGGGAALGFALPGESLSLVWPRESNQREGHPIIRPYASLRVRSLHRCSRGTSRRAVPGPSRLSRHPCRSTPYTTIPLTLLKGSWRRLKAPAGACKRLKTGGRDLGKGESDTPRRANLNHAAGLKTSYLNGGRPAVSQLGRIYPLL